MRLILAAAAAMALALGAGPLQAATLLSVGWNADCSKTTCFNEKGVFSQTFSKSDFSGPITIAQLLMGRNVLGSLDGQTFRLSFELNGEELGAWGKWNMGTVLGDELTFTGESFVWNPEDGDLTLVLQIVPPGTPDAGGGLSFAAFGGDELPGGGDDQTTDTPNLSETKPGDGDKPLGAGAVPEPGTWALMITGFGMAGAAVRRRRAVLRLQPQR